MTCLVAIEPDARSAKLIDECWKDISKESNRKILIYSALTAMDDEFAKPENAANSISLLMIPIELMGADPTKVAKDLSEKYKCPILVSSFDDPLKPVRKAESTEIKNLIYKPFDPTIFKEHTRFALSPNQRMKTQYVHTTVAKNKVEALRKFKFLQLTEWGFKTDKQFTLEVGKAYKFYHSMFLNQKSQHAWGRVVNQDDQSYEIVFVQISPAALSGVRRKVVSVKQRFKNPNWQGVAGRTQTGIDIVIHVEDDSLGLMIQQLIERSFTSNMIMHRKDFKTADKIQADLVITDAPYDANTLRNDFVTVPNIIRLHQENLEREKVEERLAIEQFRMEKPLDKAHLLKILKVLFPLLQEKEVSQPTTVPMDGPICMSEQMVVEEFSEAAMGFNYKEQFKLNEMIDIALTQEDETDLKEMRVKIHNVDEKPNQEKVFYHQGVLYGMKDEYLKKMRLWTLQMHIEKNKQK